MPLLIVMAVLIVTAFAIYIIMKQKEQQEIADARQEEFKTKLAYINRKVDYPPDLKPPAGTKWDKASKILDEPHILIGGTTGSGKSVLLNDLIFTLLEKSPDENEFIFVDLKKVELGEYKPLPHTIAYCVKPDPALFEISKAVKKMEERYLYMQQNGIKQYEGHHIWIIVDEMADLLQSSRLSTAALCTKIVRLGRAANIHLIAATQNPYRDDGGGLPKDVAQNFTAAVALRCRAEIESINIIGAPGAENLPRYGEGLFWNAEGIKRIQIPYIQKDERQKRIDFWVKYHDEH